MLTVLRKKNCIKPVAASDRHFFPKIAGSFAAAKFQRPHHRLQTAVGAQVSAYDLDVLYDPVILGATGVSFGSGLNDDILIIQLQAFGLTLPQEFDINNEEGLVGIRETSLMSDDELASRQANLALELEPFTLATIFFDVIGPGTSSLKLSLSLNKITKNIVGMSAEAFEKDNITLDDGKVAPVPEPATILLLGVGLAGLAGFRRKKFNRKTH